MNMNYEWYLYSAPPTHLAPMERSKIEALGIVHDFLRPQINPSPIHSLLVDYSLKRMESNASVQIYRTKFISMISNLRFFKNILMGYLNYLL